ncbi:helix-turn-helix transcriptional regulator [Halomonas sp.]|uniref:helix-turn-helix transcriptional regulator n=1 Tax=Halomonas sp. TaxID=1486246 RepID=UPI003A9027F9
MQDKILNIGEAAKMLGVDRTTLWRMHAKYKMIAPPARFSIGRTGYLRSYLEKWMQERMDEAIEDFKHSR